MVFKTVKKNKLLFYLTKTKYVYSKDFYLIINKEAANNN